MYRAAAVVDQKGSEREKPGMVEDLGEILTKTIGRQISYNAAPSASATPSRKQSRSSPFKSGMREFRCAKRCSFSALALKKVLKSGSSERGKTLKLVKKCFFLVVSFVFLGLFCAKELCSSRPRCAVQFSCGDSIRTEPFRQTFGSAQGPAGRPQQQNFDARSARGGTRRERVSSHSGFDVGEAPCQARPV